MFYFTSDLHLGHANIIRHCSRPFENVSEMDDVLIDNWNMRVHRDDTIYIVGESDVSCQKSGALLGLPER